MFILLSSALKYNPVSTLTLHWSRHILKWQFYEILLFLNPLFLSVSHPEHGLTYWIKKWSPSVSSFPATDLHPSSTFQSPLEELTLCSGAVSEICSVGDLKIWVWGQQAWSMPVWEVWLTPQCHPAENAIYSRHICK